MSMDKYALRPYQRDAVDAVRREWKSVRSTLMVQATGCGKTITMAAIANDCVSNGGRVLLLAHRGELLDQAADKFERAVGIECAREQGTNRAEHSNASVVVGSVQTLMNDKRRARWPRDSFSHVFVDEAHHAAAQSYQKILSYFNRAKVLGVTATPDRGDKKALKDTFETIAYEYDLRQAVEDGWLCSIEVEQVPIKIDLRKVKVNRITKDYDAGALAEAMDPHLSEIADEVARICAERKTVIFLPLIDIAQEFAEMLNARGMVCAEVDGKSPDRDEILRRFQHNEFRAITNAMLLTEGWDCPDVDCVVVLRPTKSRALYCQMVGRGTRLSPETGKEKLLLPDFLWLSEKHELCSPASLLGASGEVEARLNKRGSMEDLFAAEIEVLGEMQDERDMEEERKSEIANIVDENSDRERKKFDPLHPWGIFNGAIDPFKYALEIGNIGIADYEPTMRWEMKKPTQKQADILIRRGYDMNKVSSRGLASRLIDLPTRKQVQTLERKGFRSPGDWTFKQASEMMSKLSGNGWRIPDGIVPETYDPNSDAVQPEPVMACNGWYGWDD